MSLNDPYVFNISGGTFTLDEAQSGGAVSLSATEDTTARFQSSAFIDNNALYGGALYLSSGGGHVSNQQSEFYYNIAGECSSLDLGLFWLYWSGAPPEKVHI